MIEQKLIWEGLKRVKGYEVSIAVYTDQQRMYRRCYDVFIAIAASAGTLLSVCYDQAPLIATISIAVPSLVKAIYPKIMQSEQELIELDGLLSYYISLSAKYELLYLNYHTDKISPQIAAEQYAALKEEEADKMPILNKLQRRICSRQQKNHNQEVDEYLKRVLYNNYDTANK